MKTFEKRFVNKFTKSLTIKDKNIMTRQEFIDRTEMEITEEEMAALHEVYVIGNGTKDTFCQMVRNGRKPLLEYLINLGRAIVAEKITAVKEATAPYEAAQIRYEKENANQAEEISTLNKELEELQQFVFKTSLADEYEIKDELKDKCKELYGEAEYYAMMLEEAEDLDSFSSEDLKNIAELLRR